MRIVQMLPTLAYGDAIGNNVIAIQDALKSAGISTAIYAENIDKRIPARTAEKIRRFKDSPDTVILYHLSTGTKLNEKIKTFKSKIVIIYHNVTPPEFWHKYDYSMEKRCAEGVDSVRRLAHTPEYCIADSEFNKSDLIKLGYTCPVDSLPILIRFSDYDKKPDDATVAKYSDGYINIVFTGRVAPNKKQEDLITAFYYYHTYINPKSRLIIAGSYQNSDIYCRKLKAYKDELGLEDVIFTGHIPFDQILAIYKTASIFVCMSEHEGFCVPLVEAMYFGIPIIAFDSTAVGETLGGSGLLLKDKDPKAVAEAIDLIMTDDELRQKLIAGEKERLKYFDNDRIKAQLIDLLKGQGMA